ncbi:glycosyl hydrolase 108 family protein [Phormidium nigroviride]
MTVYKIKHRDEFDFRLVTWGVVALTVAYILVPPVIQSEPAQQLISVAQITADKVIGKTQKDATNISTNKAEAALLVAFGFEGGCQNLGNDSGNWFQGLHGFTCMGIIPSVGWNHRNGLLSELGAGFNGHPSMFVKFAYDKNPSAFKAAVAQIYKQDYFAPGGCAQLSQPAFEVCADIAINSGVGRSRQYLREIGTITDQKQLARALNERHRQDYIRWSAPGNKDSVFRAGWLSRADRRDRYIDKF